MSLHFGQTKQMITYEQALLISSLMPPVSSLPHNLLMTLLSAVGGHSVWALQDNGAREGGGRSPAQAPGVPAEGGCCVSVTATNQQPQGTGSVSGEEGL